MTTQRQRTAARQNIRKAQAVWQSMSHGQHARAQPEGRGRKKPGTTSEGNYYRVVVRPKDEFTTFRTQDVGGPGHIERVAGKRPSGSWDAQAWLVSKRDAHVQGGKLIPDSQGAKELFEELSSEPVHVKGDVF